ncbi:hypothetical protein GCM10010243_47870 [Streptomyces matensis]|nr:hypothetical protein GCM10010243_47870 [Streptomyces matensis]
MSAEGARDVERKGRMRRAALSGAAVTAGPAVAAVAAFGYEAGLPWWGIAAAGVLVAPPAGWAGSRIGRLRGLRDEVLEPGEKALGVYAVQPPYREHLPPNAHEGPQYELRLTTRHLEMWERAVLLWRHPLPELRPCSPRARGCASSTTGARPGRCSWDGTHRRCGTSPGGTGPPEASSPRCGEGPGSGLHTLSPGPSAVQSGRRESNPRSQFGRLGLYH